MKEQKLTKQVLIFICLLYISHLTSNIKTNTVSHPCNSIVQSSPIKNEQAQKL